MSDLRIHLLDVGCGNMAVILFPDGTTYLYDCNVTDENRTSIRAYLKKAMEWRTNIDAFICSHRDCDHMRGLRQVNAWFPISVIRDAGVEGTSCDSGEYRDYMSLRREIGFTTIAARTKREIGDATVRFMNAADDGFADANDQSIVMKIDFKGSSAMFAGDTSFYPWQEKILPFYSEQNLKSEILFASHHGSMTFFDDPSDTKQYYTAHIRKMNPAMTLISVGENIWDLPEPKAVELYAKYSSGSSKGNKVYRTDEQGNIKVALKSDGKWELWINQ